MPLRSKDMLRTHQRIINIDGDDIKIQHVGFEISDTAWEKFQEKVKDTYPDVTKAKSHAMRILVNALNLGIIELKDLEHKIEKAAAKVDDVIYI